VRPAQLPVLTDVGAPSLLELHDTYPTGTTQDTTALHGYIIVCMVQKDVMCILITAFEQWNPCFKVSLESCGFEHWSEWSP